MTALALLPRRGSTGADAVLEGPVHKTLLVLPLAAALALCFTLTAASSDAAPLFLKDGSTTVAAPFLPGGAVTTWVKRPARPWTGFDFACDGEEVISVDLDQGALAFITGRAAYVYSRSARLDGVDAAPCGLTRARDGQPIDPVMVLPLGLADDEVLVSGTINVLDLASGFVAAVTVVDGPEGRDLRLVTPLGFVGLAETNATGTGPAVAWAFATPQYPGFGLILAGENVYGLGQVTFDAGGADVQWLHVAAAVHGFVPQTVVRSPASAGDSGGAFFSGPKSGPCVGDSGGPAFVVSIQDDLEMLHECFVADDPDNGDAAWSVTASRTAIPDWAPGIIAVELDAGRKVTMSEGDGGWDLRLWEDGLHRGTVALGDNIQGGYIDETDTVVVGLGGNAFQEGDPDRPLVSGLLRVQATGEAGVHAPSTWLANDVTVSGAAALARLETGALETRNLDVTVIGLNALAVIAAGDSGTRGVGSPSEWWSDPDDIPGLAHVIGQVEDLLGVAPEDVAAFAVQGADAGTGERHLAAVTPAGSALRDAGTPTSAGWMWTILGDPGAGKTTLAAVQNFSTSSGDEAGNSPGGVVSSKFVDYGSGPDFDRSFSAITADPNAPLYGEVETVLEAQYGGWTELAAVETLSLSTDSQATATYVVQYTAHTPSEIDYDDLLAVVDYPVQDEAEADEIAQGVIDDLYMDHVTGFIKWTDFNGHDPGVVQLVVNTRDLVTGEVSNIIDHSCSMSSQWQSWSGTRLDATATDHPFQFELTYTLTSPDGQLVSLENAVGFGYVRDSDGDGLFDDEEYADYGTDPLEADTDGDGVLDGDDPLPLEPGVDLDWLAAAADDLAMMLDGLDLGLIDAPNGNAAANRRDNLASHADLAADRFEGGQVSSAIAQLETILDRVDGAKKPKDWLLPGDEADAIAEQVLVLLELADLL
jgi:hypothetical protein